MAAGLAATLPALAVPARADNIVTEIQDLLTDSVVAASEIGGCHFVAFREPLDPQGETWIELTASYFVGSPDVVRWDVTCWLQEGETLLTSTVADPTTTEVGAWTNPWPDREIPETRHTCVNNGPAGGCLNPVIYQVERHSTVYLCTHVRWTDRAEDPVGHVVRDVFATGGLFTLGSVGDVIGDVQTAVDNLIATLSGVGSEAYHTEFVDYDRKAPGIQCLEAASAL